MNIEQAIQILNEIQSLRSKCDSIFTKQLTSVEFNRLLDLKEELAAHNKIAKTRANKETEVIYRDGTKFKYFNAGTGEAGRNGHFKIVNESGKKVHCNPGYSYIAC